jgi:Cu/Ag efflux protein CusF
MKLRWRHSICVKTADRAGSVVAPAGVFALDSGGVNMLRRCFILTAVVAVLAWTTPVYAAEEEAREGTHEGKVVKIDGAKLTMSDKEGKDKHTHAVPTEAKITCDGKECKLTDLKEGFFVKVTAEKKGDKTVITKIEAKKD